MSACALYLNDFFTEAMMKPEPMIADFLGEGPVTWAIRQQCLDYLLDAADECKLQPLTIQRAVSLFDCMLAFKVLEKEALELLTLGCLLIAVKLEEVEIEAVKQLLHWFEEPFS